MQARPEYLREPCHVQCSILYRVSYPSLQAHIQGDSHMRAVAILTRTISGCRGHHSNQLSFDTHLQAEISPVSIFEYL